MADLLGAEMDAGAVWRRLEIEERLQSDGCRGERALKALQRLLRELDGVNRRYESLTDDQSGALARADDCIGSTLGRLMATWSAEDNQEQKTATGTASLPPGMARWSTEENRQQKPATTDPPRGYNAPYYVVAVNELIQHSDVGHVHAAHEHVLIESCATRVFESFSAAAIVEWPCNQCGRTLQFSTDTLYSMGERRAVHAASHSSAVVFRCAMCKFHLCPTCFEAGPEHNGLSQPPVFTPKLQIQRFFSLLLPHLETQSCNERIVRHLATEIRRRVFEVAVFRIADIAGLTRLFRELIEHPSSALHLVKPLPSSDPMDDSIIPWFPQSVVTWQMSMLSFLGPFFCATTITKELMISPDGVESTIPSVRDQWTKFYSGMFMENLSAIMRVLLAETQHPLVVDATLSWIATVVISINKRRLMNHDAEDRLDGFLINVNQVLASTSLEVLLVDATQKDASTINLAYHQGFVSIRGFGDKDYPEIPLRGSGGKVAAMIEEETKLRQVDQICISEFDRTKKSDPVAQGCSSKSYFYPDLKRNFGVYCDRCSTPHFPGPRYKCAFCEDSDLCQACFDVYSKQSAEDPRRQGDGPDSRKMSKFVTLQMSGREIEKGVHNLDHVYLRVGVPVPLCNAMHFEWMDFDSSKVSYGSSNVSSAARPDQECGDEAINCADCSRSLDDVDVLFKCSNCFDSRFVCETCLEAEERERDPHKMHAPGHLYLSITRGWRRLYSPHAKSLHFRSLSFLPSLVPRVRFDKASDVFHLAIKCMHHGPLATLDRYVRLVKEAKELETFCLCEEESFEFESMAQRTAAHEPRSNRGPVFPGRYRRRSTKMSSYYNSSKTRLREMSATIAFLDGHLSNPQNIASWLLFYAKTCSWLLTVASSEDPTLECIEAPSQGFCSFPEHFFVDLCDFVRYLGLKRVDEAALEAVWSEQGYNYQTLGTAIIEPIMVIFSQVLLSPAFKAKRGLRTRILGALPPFVAFFSKWAVELDRVLEGCPLLVNALAPGVLKHLCDEERRNKSSNTTTSDDSTNQSAAGAERMAEDEFEARTTVQLSDDLPTLRTEVAVLLRYLWRLPSHQATISRCLVGDGTHQHPGTELTASEFLMFVDIMWGALTRLMEEANDKITALRHLRDLLHSTDRSRGVSLPIRPHMMDGYIALHSKQLRMVFRKLIEVLECAMWMVASAPLRNVLLSSTATEQCVRALCFVFSHVAQATISGSWEFSVHLAADGKLVLAHLVTIILFCATSSGDVIQQVAERALELERQSGSAMTHRLADLDAHTRWAVQAASLGERESNSFVPLSANSRRRRRFLANLSCDGRFDGSQFNFCVQTDRARGGGLKNTSDLIGDECARAFASVMESTAHLRAIKQSVEAIVADAPEDYQDPLLGSLMINPVLLPSGKIMDRRVLQRHLQSFPDSCGLDPFTRAPLTLQMAVPCPDLASEISEYVASKLAWFDAEIAKDAQLMLGFEDNSDSDGEGSSFSRGVKRPYDAMKSSVSS